MNLKQLSVEEAKDLANYNQHLRGSYNGFSCQLVEPKQNADGTWFVQIIYLIDGNTSSLFTDIEDFCNWPEVKQPIYLIHFF